MANIVEIADSLVPDLANVPKVVRKRRAPKHDFKDGRGKVFAHRHDNGGGWVADTAFVASSVKVTRTAEVFDFARVYDQCVIGGYSRVYGHAQLHHAVSLARKVRVFGHALVRNSTSITGNVDVWGSATVGGDSNIFGRVMICDHVHLHNVRINGPRKNATTNIYGAAKIVNSILQQYCDISGQASIDASNLTNVIVENSAHISNSTIASAVPWVFNSWLNSDTEGVPMPSGFTLPDILSRISGSVICSSYFGPTLRTAPDTLIFYCYLPINYYPPRNSLDWPRLELSNVDMLVRLQGVNDLENIRSRIHDGTRELNAATRIVQAPNGAPAIPVRGIAPDPNLSRQRRLLRLGE